MAKTKVRVGDKVIKLCEERELLGRLLIIQGSRPELVSKLEETIGKYEMSVVPCSLCAVDGSLYIPTNKASLMHAVEAVKARLLVQSAAFLDVVPVTGCLLRVLIVDAMAVVQSMKKTPTMKNLSNLQEAFIKRIKGMVVGYDEFSNWQRHEVQRNRWIERVQVIGSHKCQGLIGLHNFSGADWGGKFVGITKKTWVGAYMELDKDDPSINCFWELGEGPIPTELVDNELPAQVKDLEQFVCRVYCSKGPKTLPALRWTLFRSKYLEGEMLPPTRAALLPHIVRAMCDKSYPLNCPSLPPIEENGWSLDEGVYVPVRCLTPPAPQAVIELTKCSCKTECKGRCSCFKNGLPCTPLCKCYVGNCTNVIKDEDNRQEDYDDEQLVM
ncbi:Hypothetical predicted protein [Paramuricea clavata]|uniref:Uncharacterized protein n=1 Tax=Paramuricea clavata TaxID=317549 RepID=A0A6S7FST8_PARCT|nr:Hypothetical predicted protein [Paramuricea clavata]